MKKIIATVELSIVVAFLLICSAQAQTGPESSNSSDTCDGPVFTSRGLTRKARIISRDSPAMTPEALEHDAHGLVRMDAVLCRTGRVTDIHILQGMPDGMTEKAVAAALSTKFEPAEMNGVAVSVKTAFEFSINGGGPSTDETPLDRAAGRPIDRVEVIGYRRFTREQIMKWVRTRPGDVCDPLKLERDLEAILRTGYFRKERARVYAEEGPRGTLVIIFEVYELPLISGVRFEGLKHVSERVIVDALRKERINLQKGAVVETEKMKNAERVISKVLRVNGQSDAAVELRYEHDTAFTLIVTFVISGLN